MKKLILSRRTIVGVIALIALMITLNVTASNLTTVTRWAAEYDNANGEKRIEYANKILRIMHEEKLTDNLIEYSVNQNADIINQQVWYWLGEYFYYNQSYKLALEYSLKALPLSINDEDKANCLNIIALTYFRQSKYEQAANYAKQCYKLDEKTRDPDIMSSSLNTLAGIYIGANQPKEAEQYILKGIELAKQANNRARMAVLQGMASEVYHAQGNDNEALKYINEACKIEQELGNEYKLMVRLSQKASVLIGLHDYKAAEQLLSKAIPYFEKIGDKQSQAIACNKMGMVLLCQERKNEAVEQFRIAADIFVEIGDRGNEMHSRKGLYESLWSSNPDSAKIELDRFNELKDSLYNLASAESLARYNAEFGTDWLQHENEMQRNRIRNTIIWGITLLVLLVCGVWLIMRCRMRMREAALQAIITELQPNDDIAESSQQEELSASDKELLTRLVTIVKEDMSQGNMTIESLASKLCITRGQLNRRIKSVTGVTTQQYVLRIRLEHSRLLLINNRETPISAVAIDCGFEDATSFSRAFRRTFGKSPSQYRKDER